MRDIPTIGKILNYYFDLRMSIVFFFLYCIKNWFFAKYQSISNPFSLFFLILIHWNYTITYMIPTASFFYKIIIMFMPGWIILASVKMLVYTL